MINIISEPLLNITEDILKENYYYFFIIMLSN